MIAAGQEAPNKELKQEPPPQSNPVSGAQMYKDYCAAGHGLSGKGDGPAVEFLKAPPPDLRTLAQRNGGKYPVDKVTTILQLGPGTQAHGTVDMPVWGKVFRQLNDPRIASLRVHNLNGYIESLQQK
jgi:mono/diheme cytochrome c family protein